MQIGAMLLFGMVVVSMATYQVTVVPDQNADVEYKHNQQVRDQLLEGRDALLRTATTGTSQPVTVDLGTQFPSRTMFVNPPPPSGTLETTELGTVTITNAEGTGETADYWNGDDRTFTTSGFSYTPDYSEFQTPPTTVYEHLVLFDRLSDGTVVPKTDQNLIDGRRINLVTLDGELSTTTSEAVSLDFRTATTSTRTIVVENRDPAPIVLTLPTSLSAKQWKDILADEMDADGHVKVVESGADPGTVDIRLDGDVTYELRVSEVHLGSGADEEPAQYVTSVGGSTSNAGIGDPATLTVEVRDTYNAPKSGVDVTFEDTNGFGVYTDGDGNSLGEGPVTVTTDDDGRATLTFRKAEQTGTVAATIDGATGDEPNPKKTTFTFTRASGDGGSLNPLSGFVLRSTNTTDATVTMTFENTGNDDRTVEEARVNFYYAYKSGTNTAPTTATLEKGDPLVSGDTMTIGGGYADAVPFSVDSWDSDSVNITFSGDDYDSNNNAGGFFILSLRFADGTTSTYLVTHELKATGVGGNNGNG